MMHSNMNFSIPHENPNSRKNRKRLMHAAGLLVSLSAIALSIGPANAKTVFLLALGVFGIIGNAYGVWHPLNSGRRIGQGA